ncbi:MAG: sigma-70 family RNA polymerase sigma factor [Caldilineaceae bacterium]|nr:sigma-70 family RNA polymerase sigma factor [Caldilineaceae bacterium]
MIKEQALAETALIQQAQQGCQDAYAALYQKHLSAIRQYIQRRVNEPTDAEDLTQIVFIKAWQALTGYKPGASPFRAWLYRIARNAVIDHYRTQRNVLTLGDAIADADPDSSLEMSALDAERRAVVQNAITRLRPSYQDVIVRRFLHEMDYAETAAELDRQVNGVRVIQHRALEALRKLLVQEQALWIGLVATMLILALTGPIVQAAENALPGDTAYPLRVTWEAARLYWADDVADIRLHTEFANRRIVEFKTLSSRGRQGDMVTAAALLTNQIREATAKALLASRAEENQAVVAQFKQSLTQQSATMRALLDASAPTAQTVVQEAVDVIDKAEQQLNTLECDCAPEQSSIPALPEEAVSRLKAKPAPATERVAPTQEPNRSAADHEIAQPEQPAATGLPTPTVAVSVSQSVVITGGHSLEIAAEPPPNDRVEAAAPAEPDSATNGAARASAPDSVAAPANVPALSEQPPAQRAHAEQLASDVQSRQTDPAAPALDDQHVELPGQSDMPTVNHMEQTEPARSAAVDSTDPSPSPQREHSEPPTR